MQDIYRKKNFFSKKIYTKFLFSPYLALVDIGGGTGCLYRLIAKKSLKTAQNGSKHHNNAQCYDVITSLNIKNIIIYLSIVYFVDNQCFILLLF